MANDLAGRVALVTGGARGIGKACAKEIYREGADVSLLDVESEFAQRTAQEIQPLRPEGCIFALRCDVRHQPEVESAVEKVLDEFGRIDVVVNSAGLIRKAKLQDITLADWDLQLDVNVKGTFLVTQSVVRRWIATGHRGRVINISSVHGRISFPNAAAYAATKGAVNLLTMSLASELAPYKINVNALAPGAIDTELNIPFYSPPVRAAMHKRIPWAEIGDPTDVGYAAAFLASDKARYITGEVLYVDGGLSMDGREVIE